MKHELPPTLSAAGQPGKQTSRTTQRPGPMPPFFCRVHPHPKLPRAISGELVVALVRTASGITREWTRLLLSAGRNARPAPALIESNFMRDRSHNHYDAHLNCVLASPRPWPARFFSSPTNRRTHRLAAMLAVSPQLRRIA
jgi:hypothetical protein